jgi:hypothetical protein
MGVYDIVRMRCLNCHHIFSIQTKVLREEPSLVALRTGANVDVKELILQLKDKCAQCKSELIVVVHSRKIIAVYTWNEFKREGLFGNVRSL